LAAARLHKGCQPSAVSGSWEFPQLEPPAATAIEPTVARRYTAEERARTQSRDFALWSRGAHRAPPRGMEVQPMKRFVPALFLVTLVSLFGCQTGDPEVGTVEQEVFVTCKGKCLRVFHACMRQAQTPDDEADCLASDEACNVDCDTCTDPPCP
jgi:hypothetical protein